MSTERLRCAIRHKALQTPLSTLRTELRDDMIAKISFESLLEQLSVFATAHPPRKLSAVHLHHTWRPTQAQWRGEASMHAMRDHHVRERGFSDIAQHITIDPAGGIWTGRPFELPPASARGQNGTRAEGPFMIEIVGDFDKGRDVLLGEQLQSVAKATAAVLTAAGVGASNASVIPHSRFKTKTCPGTGLSDGQNIHAWLLAEISQRMGLGDDGKALIEIPEFKPNPAKSAGRQPSNATVANWELFEVPEDENSGRAARALEGEAHARSARDVSPALARHLINVERGHFSSDGRFSQDEAHFNEIFDLHIPDFFDGLKPKPEKKRIMIHAHGGLNTESGALKYAQRHHAWWLHYGIYPLYVIWETGFFEILGDYLGLDKEEGARGRIREWVDRRFEKLARGPLRFEWNEMKAAAWEASAASLNDGSPGVLRLLARKLVPKVLAGEWEVHLVGHSAGSIIHAHLAQAISETRGEWPAHATDGNSPPSLIESVSLLAPAASVATFKAGFCSRASGALAVRPEIKKLDLYTMDENRELADNVGTKWIKAYGKSLLYLVSRGFDATSAGPGPIIGLEESIRADEEISVAQGMFSAGHDGLPDNQRKNATANLFISSDTSRHPRRTDSDTHGGFDNDPGTMHSVLARIQGGLPVGELPPVPYPDESARSKASARTARRRELFGTPAAAIGTRSTRSTPPRRRALCIGINSYPDSPLYGCVNDAYRWSTALKNLGFEVEELLEAQATRANIEKALRTLLSEAQAGDIIAFQYSGHGTWLPDDNGDEKKDGTDEALVPIDHLESGYVLDDDIAAMASLVNPQARITFFMDCCHSGSNSRARMSAQPSSDGRSRPRYLLPTAKIRQIHARTRHYSQSLSSSEAALPWIQFSACQDHEYAYETDGAGDFTTAALDLLQDSVQKGHRPQAFISQIEKRLRMIGRQQPLLMDTHATHLNDGLLSGATDDGRLITTDRPSNSIADAELLRRVEEMAALLRGRLSP
ncbi:MAG: caspase family protein [Xanthomonadales bacterium]|nr:caspase family protein [Xanthomonadales bacterium]